MICQVLAGYPPYSGHNNTAVLEKIRVGELPHRPPEIDDDVWEFLQKCWSRDPVKRPSTVEVYDAFSRFFPAPERRSMTELPGKAKSGQPSTEMPGKVKLGQPSTELPGKVKLQVQSIKVLLDKSKQQQFSVKLKYGNKDHTTSPMKLSDTSGEHKWFALCLFLRSLP